MQHTVMYRNKVEALLGEKLVEKVGSNNCCSFLLKSLLYKVCCKIMVYRDSMHILSNTILLVQ